MVEDVTGVSRVRMDAVMAEAVTRSDQMRTAVDEASPGRRRAQVPVPPRGTGIDTLNGKAGPSMGWGGGAAPWRGRNDGQEAPDVTVGHTPEPTTMGPTTGLAVVLEGLSLDGRLETGGGPTAEIVHVDAYDEFPGDDEAPAP